MLFLTKPCAIPHAALAVTSVQPIPGIGGGAAVKYSGDYERSGRSHDREGEYEYPWI